MDGIAAKILLLVATVFLFIVVIVGIVYPAITDKGNDVKQSIDGLETGYNLQLENHPTLGSLTNV